MIPSRVLIATNMADSFQFQSMSDFEEQDDSDHDDYLALEIAKTPDSEAMFRPTLADDQKIGFFSLDRATQTHDTEIIDIKELTENVDNLLDEAGQMSREINFAKSVMQADFEAKLQKKSIELYVRVNDKISEIEKMHEERVGTVRRAFKQQLADAIARMATLYNKDFASKMKTDQNRKDKEMAKMQKKVKELTAQLGNNEAAILMLKMQLEEEKDKNESLEYDWKSATPSVDHEHEKEELRKEINGLSEKVRALEEALDIKENTTADLNNEIEDLTDQLEKERIMVEQLKHEKDELHQTIEQDKASSQRMMENQKLELEQQIQDRLQQVREETLRQSKKQMDDMMAAQMEKMKRLAEEKKLAEQMLAKERATKKEEKPIIQVQAPPSNKHNEQQLMDHVARLKKEIDRVHRSWEKKFAILQQSLHALKDESFLRQTMQRQAAQLHQAAISFAYEAPVGGVHNHKNTGTGPGPIKKHPLPDIPAKGAKSPQDFMSYTVSAPSRGATTIFSVDENQVMSEGEEENLPPDFMPLPSPPQRGASMSEPDSRPSTRSHVNVVIPSVETQ